MLNNPILYEELGLKKFNLTLIFDSPENRREFIYPNRYDAWEWFLKANMLPKLKRISEIIGDRFAQK